jgi:hypothetical protein
MLVSSALLLLNQHLLRALAPPLLIAVLPVLGAMALAAVKSLPLRGARA